MKKFNVFFVAVLFTASVFAQSPEKMSYQAVIRNTSNVLITNTMIGMRIQILQGSEFGAAVYVETQTPTTNANGLATLEIGTGTIITGNFSTIDWANGPYFIKTETDPAGGTNYTITGTSQLLSVPYALYAANAGPGRGKQMFTTSGTFTVPSGVTTVWVSMSGGGGGGNGVSGGSGNSGANGGGGDDAVIATPLTVTPGASYTITVGAGGAGTIYYNIPGGNGGSSSFGTLLTTNGGAGGVAASGGGGAAGGPGGANGSSGSTFTSVIFGGAGGGSIFGSGGGGGSYGGNGGGFGGGGGGGGAGGNGAPGFVLVEW